MINIAVCGIGRAGIEVIKSLKSSRKYKIAAAFCRPGSEKIGTDIGVIAQVGEMGIKAVDLSEAERVFKQTRVDAFIDFSNPEATKMLLNTCKKFGIPGVICTTGFTEEELNMMNKIARINNLGIVYAPNVTLGVNVLIAVMKMVTRALPYYDYQITEIHHNKKLDRPSGTAKKIAKAIENELLYNKKSVPINSVRAGGYVGVHEVLIAGECERLSIVHESFSRKAFAQGALLAAEFILHNKGWYSMEDVINIGAIFERSNALPDAR
ncbi:MAG TPA: 4-hydroxy-tetrahydrodipicolinate reductase [Clostridia bacterium]|nr:4-hydroxy-tetrahydrodipicolinate reductase [Clostridia bacterium]